MGLQDGRYAVGGFLGFRVDLPRKLKTLAKEHPKEAKKALKTAMKRVNTPAKTQTKKLVRKVYALKASDKELTACVAEAIKISETSKGVEGRKTYVSLRLSSAHFSPTGGVDSMKPRMRIKGKKLRKRKRPAISMAIYKGRKLKIKGGFFGRTSKNSGTPRIIFMRTGDDRLPIKAFRTVSPVQMIQNKKVRDPLQELINTKFQKDFETIMARRINKA